MVSRRVSTEKDEQPRGRPATTPEMREAQLISLADELAEKQLTEGTASAQVITHYLKLGSSRERIEQERIAMQIALDAEKIKTMGQMDEMFGLMNKAMDAFRTYSGQEAAPESFDEIDD